MKIRIQGNSLRLRLTQKEVAELRDRNRVESSFIEFAPGRALVYLLEGSFHTTVVAAFDGQVIRVMVPVHSVTD